MGSEPAMPQPRAGLSPTFSWRAAAPPRGLSVGGKLAGGTIVLMVLVTAIDRKSVV